MRLAYHNDSQKNIHNQARYGQKIKQGRAQIPTTSSYSHRYHDKELQMWLHHCVELVKCLSERVHSEFTTTVRVELAGGLRDVELGRQRGHSGRSYHEHSNGNEFIWLRDEVQAVEERLDGALESENAGKLGHPALPATMKPATMKNNRSRQTEALFHNRC